ncbi:MAG: hypothetical protein AAF264_04910 [Pseudomonadota bacterium]
MRRTSPFALIAAALLLAGCNTAGYGGGVNNDLERAAAGAGLGALTAAALDEDIGTGAAIGAGAGIFCDDAGFCR